MTYTTGQKVGAVFTTGLTFGVAGAKPVYAIVQVADSKLLNAGDREIAEILKEVASLVKKHKTPFSEKTFEGTVYVTSIDKPPGIFDFLDVGDDGPDGKDTLRSKFYSPEAKYVAYIDNGLDGPTPGDQVFLSDGREGNHTHPAWTDYEKLVKESRDTLRKLGLSK